MEFTISKTEAVAALGFVARVVPAKTVLPVLKTILVEADENGVMFSATNLETFACYHAAAEVKEPGACCVDNFITNLIGNFDDEPIKVSKGTSKVTLTQRKRRHQPSFIDSNEFPQRKQLFNYVPIVHQDLVRAVTAVSKAASEDQSRPVLQSINFDPTKGKLAAADGYRLGTYKIVLPEGLVANIPARSLGGFLMNELKNVPGDEQVEMAVEVPETQDNSMMAVCSYIGIRTATWEVVMTSIDGKFPDYEQIVDGSLGSDAVLTLKVSCAELKNKLRMCDMYGQRSGVKIAQLVKEGDTVFLTASAAEMGDMREEFSDFTAEGEGDFGIGFAPGYLLDAISAVQSDYAKIRFTSPAAPFIIYDESDENYLCVVMPMHLNR